MTALSLARIEVRRGGAEVLRGVSLEVRPGEVVGLVGPNGAGKSTLLSVAVGTLPATGEIRLGGAPLRSLSRREVARRLAWLPQAEGTELAYRTRDIVALGRLPHLGLFAPLTAADEAAIARAVEDTSIAPLAERLFPSLSEGEKQRVLLARCLAQEAPLLLLDEPTARLDVRHAFALMAVVRERSRRGLAVLAVIHDLGLAARSCDRVVVLAEGAIVADGPPLEALGAESLARAFGMRARLTETEEGIALTVLGPSA